MGTVLNMQLRYNYRVYPDVGQRRALAMAFGCARVVWNDCLQSRKEAHAAGLPYVKSSELSKTHITQAKRTAERAWLTQVSAVILQQSLRDLDMAYSNFFASRNGERKGPKVGPPHYKSKKDSRQSIRLNTNAFKVRDDGRVYVAKVGDLKVRWSRPLPAAPSSVTVVKDAANRYFLSFVVSVAPEALPAVEHEVGLDLGLTCFAVLSDGTKVTSPRFLRRAEKKLKRLHKDQAVFVEDLAVAALARTRLAKSVHDAGWADFVRMLEYKALKHSRSVVRTDRFEPTSQLCSSCRVKDGPKPLHVRQWTCKSCGTVHERDVNAARNILAAGRADRLNASWSAGKAGTPVVAQRGEAGSRRDGLMAVAGIPGP